MSARSSVHGNMTHVYAHSEATNGSGVEFDDMTSVIFCARSRLCLGVKARACSYCPPNPSHCNVYSEMFHKEEILDQSIDQ